MQVIFNSRSLVVSYAILDDKLAMFPADGQESIGIVECGFACVDVVSQDEM